MTPSPTVQAPVETDKVETYRLLVGSAAEAVEMLQKRFGTRGRVVSVRQVGGSGFVGLLKKPRLEVLVEIGPERKAPGADPENWPKPVVKKPRPSKTDANQGKSCAADSVLRASGLDPVMIERLRSEFGGEWASLSKAEVVARTGDFLRAQLRDHRQPDLGNRRVLLGGCGAGKTTALCKMLAREIFVEGRKAAVLKLDAGQPNASDGLAAFCEVLGVPMFRSPAEVSEIDDESILYIDLPGLAPEEGLDPATSAALDRLRADARILVVNAAYDGDLIADSLALGGRLKGTHVVYTHLDELRRWGKLWRFVLNPDLKPLYFSTGPNLAGDLEGDPVACLLEQTFSPRRPDESGLESRP